MNPLLLLAGNALKGWLENRNKISAAKAEARIKNVSEGIPGFSDDFLRIVWCYPFIAVFIPQLRPHIEMGFEYMGKLPDWYVGGFTTISFATFGIDKVFKWKSK